MQEHAEALLTGANASSSITPTLKTTADTEAEPELDIVINNVVCSFSVRCHLKLRDIALNGSNVEYRRENGMVTMKLRRPYTTASIWSSGRITCTGATSEIQAKIAARRYARCLAKLGFPTHFQNFRIVNVLGTCSMPWAIKIVNFSERHRNNASYEPELHPGVTYKMREPKATLKIFSTGSITVTAASVNDVESAIQHIYPLVHEFRKQRSAEELQHLRAKQRHLHGGGGGGGDANANVNELENQAVEQAKLAGKDDIFVNSNAAAHSAAAKASDAPATLAATPSNNLSLASATTTQQQQQRTANVNVAATGANIINTTNISNKIHINNHQLLQPNAKLRQNVVVMRARNATTTTTTTAAGIGMGMGMGTATIVRAASSAAVGATVYKQQQQQQLVQTFSPADFQDVDDLIEEDVEDELEDMHF
ncbi:Trf2 [Drosophila busckii]|uniref:TATA box-binding protein-like 1 n=1 Tax=Drosophila busckii TaxID=30019 RepID=A0A0M4ESW8_DROBS|nr:Trf2 [Drosophila busckii]